MKKQQSQRRIVENFNGFNKLNEEFGSYWNNSGKFQKEYDEMYQELVPLRGPAPTVKGELIRAVSRLYYEAFNNGNMNAQEWGQDEDGYRDEDEDEYEDEVIIGVTYFYMSFLEFISKIVPDSSSICDKIEGYIMSENPINDKIYDELINKVVKFCLSGNPILDKSVEQVDPYYFNIQK